MPLINLRSVHLTPAELATIKQAMVVPGSGLVKAQAEAEASYRKYIDGINKSADSMGDMADKQEAANATFGKSKVAIAEMYLELDPSLNTDKWWIAYKQ